MKTVPGMSYRGFLKSEWSLAKEPHLEEYKRFRLQRNKETSLNILNYIKNYFILMNQ